jgi:hypothetical protein
MAALFSKTGLHPEEVRDGVLEGGPYYSRSGRVLDPE